MLWSDIGGQEDVKQRLKEAVEWPLQHPEVSCHVVCCLAEHTSNLINLPMASIM